MFVDDGLEVEALLVLFGIAWTVLGGEVEERSQGWLSPADLLDQFVVDIGVYGFFRV